MTDNKPKHAWVYMLECTDSQGKKSIYTGMTTDIERRMVEHMESCNWGAGARASQYMRAQEDFVHIWTSDELPSVRMASKMEKHIKQMIKDRKYALASGDIKEVERLSRWLAQARFSW